MAKASKKGPKSVAELESAIGPSGVKKVQSAKNDGWSKEMFLYGSKLFKSPKAVKLGARNEELLKHLSDKDRAIAKELILKAKASMMSDNKS